MSPSAMAARALPLTFFIYCLHACMAWVVGLAPALEFLRQLPADARPLPRAAWLETLLASTATFRVSALTLALACLLLALVSPALQMAWLVALDTPTSVLRSLAQGARLWLRAVLVSFWVAIGSGLAALPFGLGAWGIACLFENHPNERLHDLALLGALSPLLAILWLAHTWHDLARARALYQSSFKSSVASLRDAIRPRIQLSALGWAALGLGAALLTHWGATRLGSSPLAARVGLLQGGVLLHLISRSRWLARALTCAEAKPESAARHQK